MLFLGYSGEREDQSVHLPCHLVRGLRMWHVDNMPHRSGRGGNAGPMVKGIAGVLPLGRGEVHEGKNRGVRRKHLETSQAAHPAMRPWPPMTPADEVDVPLT